MIEYKILKELESNPSHTQRSLAQKLDVSVGKINYILSGLIEKGILKARRLKNEPGSIRWKYILTPKGLREKAQIASMYLRQRMIDFENIQQEIHQLKDEVVGNKDQKQTIN